jgi:Flp pilus assembly protein TadD
LPTEASRLYIAEGEINLEHKYPEEGASSLNHFDRAEELAEDRLYAEAVEEYRLAIEESPNCSDAYNGLGLALNELGLKDEAMAA